MDAEFGVNQGEYSFLPDMKHWVAVVGKHTLEEDWTHVILVDAASGKIVATRDSKCHASRLTLSPDGTKIALPGPKGLHVLELVNGEFGELRQLCGEGDIGGFDSCVWSPDMTRLAATASPRKMYIIDVTSGAKQKVEFPKYDGMLLTASAMCWAPNKDYIAIGGIREVVMLNADTYEVMESTLLRDSPMMNHEQMVWCPTDHNVLSFMTQLKKEMPALRLYNVVTGSVTDIRAKKKNEKRLKVRDMGNYGWTPDGTRVVFGLEESPTLLVYNVEEERYTKAVVLTEEEKEDPDFDEDIESVRQIACSNDLVIADLSGITASFVL
eukprot:GFYU01003387.1.p1 GENE.GFYU01003387.1~~GFYU01003387.1.p1  ORF type:complete len:332 (-),score=84.52 GFYU01003387.1:211-1185(-)